MFMEHTHIPVRVSTLIAVVEEVLLSFPAVVPPSPLLPMMMSLLVEVVGRSVIGVVLAVKLVGAVVGVISVVVIFVVSMLPRVRVLVGT